MRWTGRPSSQLFPDIHEDGQDDADEDAGHNGETEGEFVGLNKDVSGEFAEREFAQPWPEKANCKNNGS